MEINLSLVLIFGIVFIVMLRSKSLKFGPALVALFFGFFLASTGLADGINEAFVKLGHVLEDFNL